MEAETSTATVDENPGVGLDRGFLRSRLGLLFAGALLSALVLAICGGTWSVHSGAFVALVGWTLFLKTGALMLLYLFRMLPLVPGPFGLLILIYLALASVSCLLAAFTTAAFAGRFWPWSRAHSERYIFGTSVACAIFSVTTMLLHAAIGFLLLQKWPLLRSNFHRAECGHIGGYSVARQIYLA